MANTKIPSELVAINAISGTLIADNAITSVHIAENNITATQIAINAVTALQMADGTITSAKIADGTIVTADIADGQITTGKLADSSVTTDKIAAGTIASADIANNAILTQHIDDNQITADQIADNAVGVNQLAGITRGSVLTGNAAGNPSLLALGAANTLLQSDGTDLVFAPLQSGIDDNSNAVAITIDSSEKVSIGGTNPTYKFVISNNNAAGIEFGPEYATDANLVQHYDRTANAYMDVNTIAQNHRFGRGAVEHMRITNLGKVGIGTTSPGSVLDVRGEIRLDSGGSTSRSIYFRNQDSSSTGGGQVRSDQHLSFHAGNGSGAPTQYITIKPGGNVGIGTTNPTNPLSISVQEHGLYSQHRPSNSNGVGQEMYYKFNTADGTPEIFSSIYSEIESNANGAESGKIALRAAKAGNLTTGLILIGSTGNVGIGTTSPQTKLHVFKGESNAPAPLADSTLVLENSTHNYLQFLGPNTTQQGIVFGDSDNDNVASVAYNHNTDDLDITALDNVNIVADVLNYSNSAGTGYFHMSGSSSRYADHGFWVADNYQLEVGNAHIYLKTQTSAKDIILGTHNTERMRISGSGYHIGMGTGNHFVIAEDGAGTYLGKDNNSSLRFITANATRMTINNTGTTILTSGATNLGVLQLSSSVATYQLKGGDNIGYMGYYTGGYHRWFGSDGVEDMKLTSTGLVVTNANNYQGIHAKGSNAPCFTLGKNSSSTPEWRMGITGYDGDDFAISTGTSTNDRFRMDPSGNSMIGSANNVAPIAMHDTVATFSARGPIASGYSMGAATAGPRNTRDWFVYSGSGTMGSNLYVHMKTNIWGGGSPNGNIDFTMSCFTYKDYYAYGGSGTTGGYIGWHNWSGSFYNVHLVNDGTLTLVQSSYVSSDGYVVLVAKVGTSYAQFSIDWCQWAGYTYRERKVTAVTNTASATGAY